MEKASDVTGCGYSPAYFPAPPELSQLTSRLSLHPSVTVPLSGALMEHAKSPPSTLGISRPENVKQRRPIRSWPFLPWPPPPCSSRAIRQPGMHLFISLLSRSEQFQVLSFLIDGPPRLRCCQPA